MYTCKCIFASLSIYISMSIYLLACLCACVYSVQILIAQSLVFARSKSQGPPDENV